MTIAEKPDCPEKKWKRAGDETYCICKLEDIMCLEEYTGYCDFKEEEDDG